MEGILIFFNRFLVFWFVADFTANAHFIGIYVRDCSLQVCVLQISYGETVHYQFEFLQI